MFDQFKCLCIDQVEVCVLQSLVEVGNIVRFSFTIFFIRKYILEGFRIEIQTRIVWRRFCMKK